MKGELKMRILKTISCLSVFIACIHHYSFASDKIMGYLSSGKEINHTEVFAEVLTKIKGEFVEESNEKKLLESALEGMLSSLDPHSSYLTAKEYGDMINSTRGEFGGLGIEVTMENGFLKIISPYEDGPAFKAGVKAGDYITMINGQVVKGMTGNEAVEKLRGKPKTKVDITVYRESLNESIEMTISREIIKIIPVKSKLVAGDIALIRITNFGENTAQIAKKEYYKLVDEAKAHKKEIRGVILDLRYNPGGLLSESVAVTELFIEEGIIVSTKGRMEDTSNVYKAKGFDITEGLPVVVIINGGSASASEIVAGALQDNKRAMLVGTKTFGKGSVQLVTPLASTGGAIKLTISRYYTPSGRSIQAKGIDPDLIVEDAIVTPIKSAEQGSEASLVRHLDSSNEQAKDQSGKASKKRSTGRKEEEDYQMLRAIDLVKGMALYYEKLSD